MILYPAIDLKDGVCVRLMHGRFDPVLPIGLGEAARDQVQQLGYAVDWRHYAMQHQVCMEQITEIGEWLVGRLPPV